MYYYRFATIGRVLLFTLVFAGISVAQWAAPADLVKYLGLSDAQVTAINALNSAFSDYTDAQQTKFYQVVSQAASDLGQTSPDASAVGQDYAQLEMMRRDYYTQLAQVQSKVAALLTPGQVALVNGLLQVERLQPIVAEAECAYFFNINVPTAAERQGDFSTGAVPMVSYLMAVPRCSQVPPLPVALTNYLTLTDGQVSTIENAISGYQDYLSRQALKIKELQNAIKDLTAAPTIDTAALGADYVAIAQIDAGEAAQSNSLPTTIRSVVTDAQKPLLQALDNAASSAYLASEAVCNNILVLPPDLQTATSLSGAYPSNLCVPTALYRADDRTAGYQPAPPATGAGRRRSSGRMGGSLRY